jgi:hypothetical protein
MIAKQNLQNPLTAKIFSPNYLTEKNNTSNWPVFILFSFLNVVAKSRSLELNLSVTLSICGI